MLQSLLLKLLEVLFERIVSPVWARLSSAWKNLSRSKRALVLLAITVLCLSALLARPAYRLYRVALDTNIPLGRAVVALQTMSRYTSDRVAADLSGLQSSARFPIAVFARSDLHDDERDQAVAALMKSLEPTCNCWRFQSESNHAPHVPSTAWSILALARLNAAPPDSAFDFLVRSQRPSGAWSLHGGGDPEYGSTYATALVLLALQAVVNEDLVEREKQFTAKNSIRRGHKWLVSRLQPNQVRWADYPDAQDRPSYLSISGLVLHTLHQLGRDDEERLRALDRLWISSLPPRPPSWESIELSRDLRVYTHGPVPDAISFRAWPWMVLGTVAAYPNGTLREQHRAAGWLERALDMSRTARGFPTDADPAEYLIALRALESSAQ